MSKVHTEKDNSKRNLSVLNVSEDNMVSRSLLLYSSISTPISAGAYKLFDLYLSLINPLDTNTSALLVPKSDYLSVLNQGRIRKEKLDKDVNELSNLAFSLSNSNVSNNSTKTKTILLFDEVSVQSDEITGEDTISFKASKKAESLFFNLTSVGYIKYQLKNTLALSTKYEIRLYLYLQRQKFLKKWSVRYNDLKQQLYCDTIKKYNDFFVFNQRILSPAIRTINEKTDLTVDYSYKAVRGKGSASGVLTFRILSIGNMLLSENLESDDSEEYAKSSEQIKGQIRYSDIVNTDNIVYIDQIVHIMTEIDLSDNADDKIKINGLNIPISQIQQRLRTLTDKDILYVYQKFKDHGKVKNVRLFLISCLYNAKGGRKIDEIKKSKSSYNIDELSKFHELDDFED